jgi:hypothetical protein
MLQRWEYVCVSVIRSYGMNYRRNGIKVGEWKDRPIFEMLGKMGEEGYELTAYDGTNYIFKRPKGTPVGTNAHPDAVAQPAQMQPIPRQNPQQRPPQPGQSPQRPPQPGQPGQAPRPLQQRPPQPGQPGQAPRPLQQRPPQPKTDTDDLRGIMDDEDE